MKIRITLLILTYVILAPMLYIVLAGCASFPDAGLPLQARIPSQSSHAESLQCVRAVLVNEGFVTRGDGVLGSLDAEDVSDSQGGRLHNHYVHVEVLNVGAGAEIIVIASNRVLWTLPDGYRIIAPDAATESIASTIRNKCGVASDDEATDNPPEPANPLGAAAEEEEEDDEE